MRVNIREIAPCAVRMQPYLKRWFQEYAKENDRSVNYVLNEALEFFKQHKEEEKKIAGI
ncbi:hypothetical protein RHO12_03100 [Orbus sturtevantii]|uniref:hypothetical protein n=1 Tax=Orbus sturtevantii TaxID=3074109 RepID=UPI00370D60E1